MFSYIFLILTQLLLMFIFRVSFLELFCKWQTSSNYKYLYVDMLTSLLIFIVNFSDQQRAWAP